MPKLADLPDLHTPEHLTHTIAVRITAAERRRLELIAGELGAPVGRVVRAVLRQALAEATQSGCGYERRDD